MEDRRVEEAIALLQTPERPTALIAYEMDTALPILFAARTLGLRVPGDLSLLMFHDSFNPVIGVSITTMMLNTKSVGTEAVAMLEEKMLRPMWLCRRGQLKRSCLKARPAGHDFNPVEIRLRVSFLIRFHSSI
jgi:DNA-binding LacI/PurR family transcriptional regulator